MLITHKNKCGKSIGLFIDKFEDKMKLSKRSIFGPTQREDVTWLVVSRWWIRSNVRRSLFTALLRVGQNYKPQRDNFQTVLFANCYGKQNYYTRQTKKAVERFMDGYTILDRKAGFWYGWWDCFYDADTSWYKKAYGYYRHELLIKPKCK
jgi:hypothetical protein